MGDDDLLALSARMGVSPADILGAQKTGSWPEEIKKILIENARKKHAPTPLPSGGQVTQRRIPAKAKPAVQPPTSTTATPILMRATLRVHFSKFNKDFLPQEIIYAMMRNQVVPALPSTIPSNMLEWCEKNCADYWMPSPPAKPEYIMFASEVDMTLFLTTFGGG